MNHIKVLFFATLRDCVGAKFIEMDVPSGSTIQSIKHSLLVQYPCLEKVQDSMVAAVNREYAAEDQPVPLNAEIAFFPPVSGG